ncbi:MAG: disulfide bond formation protein B [Rhodospirillaceae bacterium]|jgi:disulfide bond formation protein DsbB|nr:disulfide bond formation protein B [Rhodospirillaceae bacterium]MBT5242621.1 disulfide bond formation protein B [Rhodospirillaceae bacterium]MBT5562784.1 disulfide bond formation protein B [Rhodospirillaceae bacterium]MBT6241213.1 disulfide bond formation protein B [Rhodospirillaceae bacterium]MBT7137502.1 disulfide bond formation protein B [Rhodospirillaceae bacterium]
MPFNRLIPAFIFLVTVGALSLALTAQHVYRLEPCILCLYQRIPFIVTGLLAVLALRLKASSVLIPLIIIICGLVYLVGAGIAVYHVGVEQHWWLSGCSGTLSDTVSLQDLRSSLMQKPEKSCDDVDWTLFGISMATYNVIGSGVLGMASIAAGIQLSKTRKT